MPDRAGLVAWPYREPANRHFAGTGEFCSFGVMGGRPSNAERRTRRLIAAIVSIAVISPLAVGMAAFPSLVIAPTSCLPPGTTGWELPPRLAGLALCLALVVFAVAGIVRGGPARVAGLVALGYLAVGTVVVFGFTGLIVYVMC